jgi:hypothetical protein
MASKAVTQRDSGDHPSARDVGRIEEKRRFAEHNSAQPADTGRVKGWLQIGVRFRT